MAHLIPGKLGFVNFLTQSDRGSLYHYIYICLCVCVCHLYTMFFFLLWKKRPVKVFKYCSKYSKQKTEKHTPLLNLLNVLELNVEKYCCSFVLFLAQLYNWYTVGVWWQIYTAFSDKFLEQWEGENREFYGSDQISLSLSHKQLDRTGWWDHAGVALPPISTGCVCVPTPFRSRSRPDRIPF